MKVISLHNDKRLIKKAIKQERAAQQALYNRYAPKMLSVCRLYIRDAHFAEDVMIQGFFKVFKHLKTYKQQGSFEGWIRRIMIREAIDFIRRQKQLDFSDDLENDYQLEHTENTSVRNSDTAYLQNLIDNLPEGYKMVFVMFTIEGYKHREIAEMLHISEGTSKSQLAKARKLLQQQLSVKEGRL